MVNRDLTGKVRVDRRGLLKGIGLAGLGAFLWKGLGGGSKAAFAGMGPAPDIWPSTSILQTDGSTALLRTGPFQSYSVAPGTRLALCFLVPGVPQGARVLPLVTGVGQASASLPALGTFARDEGVDQGVYRILDGFSTVRPVELYGLSLTVPSEGIEAEQSFDFTWEVALRAGISVADLRQYLGNFHALVMGELAPTSTFTGRMSYVEIRRVL